MKLKTIYSLAAAACGGLLLNLSAQAQGTAFTYQGQLTTTNGPANGNYDFTFSLFNNFTNGSPLGGTVVVTNVEVTNGLFTLPLDFGSVFNGEPAWLGMSVRSNASGSYMPLSPLQELTPTPYAVYASSASASNLVGTVPSANLSTNAALRAGGNAFTGNQTVLNGSVGIGTKAPAYLLDLLYGGGALGVHVFANGGGYSALLMDANDADAAVQFANGGSYKWSIANDGAANGLKFVDASSGTTRMWVQSGTGNVGIGTTTPTTALQVNGTVTAAGFSGNGGGLTNLTAAGAAVVTRSNSFSGNQIFTNGNIGIGTNAPLAQLEVLANNYGAQPLGIFAVENCGAACGQQDFQENIRLINQNGNGQTGIGFLTADTWTLGTVPNAWIGTDYGSSANNLKFCTQNGGALTSRMYINGTTGNVGIGTSAPAGPLEVVTADGTLTVSNGPYTVEMVVISPGAGGHMRFRNGFEVWPDNAAANAGYLDVRNTNNTQTIVLDGGTGNITCVAVNITSDRNAKEDFKNLSPRDVLAKVASLPITEWQYKAEKTKDASAARHIGPMAQDFSAAFELGHDEKHISVVDESGVALAAIQGLNEELKETRAENAELKHTVSELKSMMEQIQRNLAAGQNK